MTIVRHPRADAAALPRPGDEEARKGIAAALRALPLQRLVGNGMDLADAMTLRALAEAGVRWSDAAAHLGDAALRRARAAQEAGHIVTARSSYRFASACYRFGQSALMRDDDEKRALYTKARDAFAASLPLDDPPGERFETPFGGGRLSGWLLRPKDVADPPVVMIFGGADGWREEYHAGAEHLVQRGVAALLIDGSGQGESRILDRVHLDPRPERAFSAVVDALEGAFPRIGIWGNSLGGCLAARTASADKRIAACCVNGGSAEPVEVLERFPRFLDRICAMLGDDDEARAGRVLAELRIPAEENRITCPLLVMHGDEDRIFLTNNAAALYRAAPSVDKRMVVWEDGDHCLYNHSHEKHALVADWFGERLGRQGEGM